MSDVPVQASVRLFFARVASALLVLGGIVQSANAVEPTLSDAARAQISALIAEKDARTPAQQKIDSQLIYAARMARGVAVAAGVATLDTDIEVDAQGLVAVEIRAPVSTELDLLVKSVGGEVIRSFAFADATEARLPLDRIEQIAADPRVRFIMPPSEAILDRADRSVGFAPAAAVPPRLQRFRATLQTALAAHAAGASADSIAQPDTGTVNSQGDLTHGANTARSTFTIDGAGIRIGVLSDSFNKTGTAPADITSGNLPGVGNPNGYTTPVQLAGSGDASSTGADEGRAMLQIVHDLAPGAQLYFATANVSITDFANNIRALGGIAASAPPNGNITPGCNIIIDDVFYFVESGLHDGQAATSNQNIALVTQAVNDVTANGTLYFSSAGNSGGVTQGTSGAWEGDFVSGTRPAVISGTGDALAWNGTDVGNTITTSGSTITMQWSDPIGASTNDYDLFRLNSALTSVQNSSTNVQNGTQDPYERVTSAANTRIVVVRRSGAEARFISLSSNRGRLQYATTGQTRGHSTALNAFGVAATPAAASAGAPAPTGPYPSVFVASNQVEYFSSDGPRRLFFNADGSAITPGNFLAGTGGGLVRQKPDITAADGVATTLPGASGLNPFYGTSAAAPHAGAIAALVKQVAPTVTAAQVRNILTSTALDIMGPGVDRDSGAGIVQAFQAVQAAAVVPQAVLNLGTVAVITGNNVIDPNECNTLSVGLQNNGTGAATAVSAVLSTLTPGITITQPAAVYSDLASAGGAGSAQFEINSAPTAPAGATINFTLSVNYAGGASPRTFDFALPLGADIHSYVVGSTPAGVLIPAGGTLVAGSHADDAVVTTTTPFAFSIYATPVAAGQTISVSTNGNIQFVGNGASKAVTNTALSARALPGAPAVFPYWDDLDLTTSGGGIYTHTIGNAPQRQYIVEWRGRLYRDGAAAPQTVDFAVVFNENSSSMQFLYAQTGLAATANGAGATIGVQAGNGEASKSTGYSQDSAVILPGLQLDFTLPAGVPGSGTCADYVFADRFE